MLDWDMVEPYEFHKLQLKMLNAQRSAKRWVLKCPWHIWNMDALMAVYPDAQMIFTHRDITKALASHCSLSAKMASKLKRSLDVKELGEFWLDYTRIGLERAMESRKKIPESQLYDVRLRDLMANPMTVLQGHLRALRLGVQRRDRRAPRGAHCRKADLTGRRARIRHRGLRAHR